MLWAEYTMEDAMEAKFEEGREEAQAEIARNALAEGLSIETVQKITGFSFEAIEKL